MTFRAIARVAGVLAMAGAGWYLLNPEVPARAQNRVDFARDVQPIFQESCVGCHGPEQQMAGLRLDRRAAVSGNRIRPGSSSTSRVYLRISSSDFGQQMPLTGALSAEAINTIKTWIDEGAVWPDALAGEAAVPPPIDAGATAIAGALRADDQRAFTAALANHPDAVNRLAAGGATPLMFASLYGNAAAVRGLLALGANPNFATDPGTTALMWAVGDEAVTRLLLDAGARPDAANAQNVRPVAIASMRFGAEPIVKLLLERGAAAAGGVANAAPSARPSGALPVATAAGDERVFRLLVDSGVDPQAATWQALANAVQTNCQSCIDTLLAAARPAELNAALVALAGLPHTTVIQRLLERGADPNARVMSMRRDLRGRTPLMVAASSDYLPAVTVKMLLDRGADPNAAGPDGETPLDLAKRNGPTPVVEMLVAAGARPGKGFPRPALTPRPAMSPRAAVERAIPLLQRADVTFIQKTGCVACHHNVYAAMTLAAARAFEDLRPLVLRDHPLELHEELILGGCAPRCVEKDRLHALACELFDQQHLIGILATQAIRGVDEHRLQLSLGREVAHPFEAGPLECCSAKSFVFEDPGLRHLELARPREFDQRCRLARNRMLLALLLRRDAGVDRRHLHLHAPSHVARAGVLGPAPESRTLARACRPAADRTHGQAQRAACCEGLPSQPRRRKAPRNEASACVTISPRVSPLRRACARRVRTVLTGSLNVMATVGSTAATGALSAVACSR